MRYGESKIEGTWEYQELQLQDVRQEDGGEIISELKEPILPETPICGHRKRDWQFDGLLSRLFCSQPTTSTTM